MLDCCTVDRQIPVLVTAGNVANMIFLAHKTNPDDADRWSNDFLQILESTLPRSIAH
jgi:hypothetical protein